jgi:hypothetical protein
MGKERKISEMRITVRKEHNTGMHTTLRIWVNGALTGTIVLRNDEVDFVIGRLKPEKLEVSDK